MDAASLLLGLLLGALLATAATLALVALLARRRPVDSGLEPVHESLDPLHRLLTGMERARATAHGELREQMGTVGQASAQLKQEPAALVTARSSEPCAAAIALTIASPIPSPPRSGPARPGSSRWNVSSRPASAPPPSSTACSASPATRPRSGR